MTCGNEWPKYLVIIYGLSDCIMLLGYSVVAYLFFNYLKPRHVTMLRKIFAFLGYVFVLCGATHGIRIISFFFYIPHIVVLINIISSIITIILLLLIVPMIPAIMKFPQESAMFKANVKLRQEISDLLETNAKLATVNNIKAVSNIDCAIKAIIAIAKTTKQE